MADQKISELTALTGANVADDDAIAIVDTSATETKKIVFSELKNALDTSTGFVRITGDTMTGALDVQSTITADGLTVGNATSQNSLFDSVFGSGDANEGIVIVPSSTGKGWVGFNNGNNANIPAQFTYNFSSSLMELYSSGSLNIQTGAASRLNIASNGDISFYEDTGTTPKFFWDASAESLGIGTSSPDAKLNIGFSGADQANSLRIEGSNGSSERYALDIEADGENAKTYFKVGVGGGVPTTRMTIDSSGNVGIGTSSPQDALHIAKASAVLRLEDTDTSHISTIQSGGSGLIISADAANTVASSYMGFSVDTTERMRIDSSGDVGIGTSSPSQALHIANSGFAYARMQSTGYGGTGFDIGQHTGGSIYLNNRDNTSIILQTNNTERMRIDSSGNVGIGITPVVKLDVQSSSGIIGRIQSTSGDAQFNIAVPNVNDGILAFGDASAYRASIKANTSDALTFQTGSSLTERMRIDSSGNVLINKTSAFVDEKFTCNGGSTRAAAFGTDGTSNFICISIHNGNGAVGSITTSGSSTSYNTSSDQRLKENVVELTGATERLKQLNPSRFNFIADADTTVDGFLAHEVQTVVPEAITGTHNEVDADGNPVYQGIDQSKLVPLLVATIKELEARITALENA